MTTCYAIEQGRLGRFGGKATHVADNVMHFVTPHFMHTVHTRPLQDKIMTIISVKMLVLTERCPSLCKIYTVSLNTSFRQVVADCSQL